MEKIINIHIKKLPDGIYLATSKDIQGLVAQGRTATEALEIAREGDVRDIWTFERHQIN